MQSILTFKPTAREEMSIPSLVYFFRFCNTRNGTFLVAARVPKYLVRIGGSASLEINSDASVFSSRARETSLTPMIKFCL